MALVALRERIGERAPRRMTFTLLPLWLRQGQWYDSSGWVGAAKQYGK